MIPIDPSSRFQHAEVCHRGLVREENQDATDIAEVPGGTLFLVSDGVGGYAGGADAARMIVAGALNAAHGIRLHGDPMPTLVQMVKTLNEEVHAAGQRGAPELARMSATLVMAFVRSAPSEAYILNVGDSRAYLSRADRLQQLTTDHTAAQMLVEAGTISHEEARTHSQASVLTRSMGQRLEVSPSTARVPLEAGDLLLLCSDGLHGYVEDGAIEQVLLDRTSTLQVRADALLRLALDAGGEDNITVQLVEAPVSQPGAAAGASAAVTRSAGHAGAAPTSHLRRIAMVTATAGVLAAAAVAGYGWWQSQPPRLTQPPALAPAIHPDGPPSAIPVLSPVPAEAPASGGGAERARSTPSASPATRPSGTFSRLPDAVHDNLDRILTGGRHAGNRIRRALPGSADPPSQR